MSKSDDEDENSNKHYLEPDIIVKQIGEKDAMEFEVIEEIVSNSKCKKRKTDNSYENADFYESSTQGQCTGGLDFSQRTNDDLLSNPFQPENGGKKRVIIVRAKSDKKIFGNPSICKKILHESVFGKLNIEEIDVRGNGRSIKFEVNADDVSGVELEKIEKVGSYSVSVRAPLLESYTVGVIGSFDRDVDLVGEVLPNPKVINSTSKIVEIKRIMNKEGPTEQVKVVFEGNMPKKMSLNGLIYSVRKFDFNPKRCFRCSLYGHSSDSCNRKIFCAFCGSNHYLSECPGKKAKGDPKCRHCKGQHVSCSNKCKFFQAAKKIENKSKSGKISLDETRKQYNSLNKKDLISLNKLVDTDEKDKGLSAKTEKRNQNINSNDYDSDDSYISINNSFSCLTEDELSDDDPDEVGFWPSSPKKTNISKNLRNNKSNNKKIIKGNKQDEIQQSSSKDYSLPKPLSDKSVLSKKENANILVEKTLFSNIVKGNKAENQKKNFNPAKVINKSVENSEISVRPKMSNYKNSEHIEDKAESEADQDVNVNSLLLFFSTLIHKFITFYISKSRNYELFFKDIFAFVGEYVTFKQ